MAMPQRRAGPHSEGVASARFDTAHRSLPSPWLLAQWSQDFGWHRSLADTAPMPRPPGIGLLDNSTTPAVVEVRASDVRGGQAGPLHASASTRPAASADYSTAESRATRAASPARLKEMLVEAAHDIRSPIAVAQQILSTLAGRMQRTGQLASDQYELLEEANVRLTQANRWAEGILVEQGLQYGHPVSIRRRFYPGQWLAEIRPLLQSLASQRQVRLTWLGWDLSLIHI